METDNSLGTDRGQRFYDTEHGRFYEPPSEGVATATLVGLMFVGLFFPLMLYMLPLGLPEGSHILLIFSFGFIFGTGYTAWVSMAATLGTNGILWPALKKLLGLLLRGQKPSNLQDVLPDESEMARLGVKLQKGARVFSRAGWIYGLLAAAISLLLEGALGTWPTFGVVLGLNLAWGYGLAYVGRRGYLPFGE